MNEIKLVQAIVATLICAMATVAAALEIVSGDALIGLLGGVVGYIFGDSTARRDARIAAEHVVEEHITERRRA